MAEKDHRLQLRLPVEMWAAVLAAAEAHQISGATFIRDAIETRLRSPAVAPHSAPAARASTTPNPALDYAEHFLAATQPLLDSDQPFTKDDVRETLASLPSETPGSWADKPLVAPQTATEDRCRHPRSSRQLFGWGARCGECGARI